MEKAALGLSSIFGAIGGVGIFVADILPTVPAGYEDWPATAIFGFITLIALGLNYLIVCRLFKAIESLNKVADTSIELNARLNVRPCLRKQDQ